MENDAYGQLDVGEHRWKKAPIFFRGFINAGHGHHPPTTSDHRKPLHPREVSSSLMHMCNLICKLRGVQYENQ